MTWSIIARDEEHDLFGIAIASRFFAVGAHCPWAEGGVGAVSSQALLNPLLARAALGWLRAGFGAGEALDLTIRCDTGAGSRQLHLMDRSGAMAGHTGADCVDWAGHICEEGISVAGNMLAGEAVIAETLKTYKQRSGESLVERLLSAMEAGEAAGGDKRGKQAAAILVQGPDAFPLLSMRVDDHGDPLAELRRLYQVSKERFLPFSAGFPSPGRPCGIADRQAIEALIDDHTGIGLEEALALRRSLAEEA